MRIYLDSCILIIYCFGKEMESGRYRDVERLFDEIRSEKIKAIISFYTIHELFVFALENFPKNLARKIGKESLLKILSTPIELVPLLHREQRIIYSKDFKISDASDIPHAILAFIEDCDCVVTYDIHFNEVKDKIGIKNPGELLDEYG